MFMDYYNYENGLTYLFQDLECKRDDQASESGTCRRYNQHIKQQYQVNYSSTFSQ